MLLSVFVYLGLGAAFVGLVCLVKPIRVLGVRTRRRALGVLGAGVAIALVGFALPAREVRADPDGSRLDAFAPVWEFGERHSIRILASRDRVDQAIREVSAEEVFLFRALVWLRRFGRSVGESLLEPPRGKPLLDVATDTSFLLLADEPGEEIVIGTAVVAPCDAHLGAKPTPEDFKGIRRPGFALATMNFRIDEDGREGCTLTTETRVHATDAATRRAFAVYWRLIYPGSAWIRRSWLRAIQRRAEAPA